MDFGTQPIDYASIIGQGQKLAGNPLQDQQTAAQTGLLNAETQRQQAEATAEAQKQARFTQFQNAIHTYDGSPQSAAKLIMQFPEYADQLKSGQDMRDNAANKTDLLETGQIYSAAQGGNWGLAKQLAHQRADAEKAAGHDLPPGYAESLAVLDKAADGDETSRKVVLNLLGTHLAAVTGPEHFASVYGALKGGTHVVPMGGMLTDDDGKMIAHSPLIEDKAGNIRGWTDGTGGGDPSSPGAGSSAPGMTPAVASVASTLSSKLPAPVVAGFLGNFHAEGGYSGAQGDGGSASGIAQWHDDRAANFEKVIGKPVTEATPQEQAQFVLWEMDHPESAGMTPKQRDAILAAKSPAQAAALIDQYYERSDGKARSGRMAAATAFAGVQSGTAQPTTAGDKFPILIPGKEPPRILSDKEAVSMGLPTSQKYQMVDGKVEAVPNTANSDAGTPGPELDDAATQYLLTGQMPALGMGSAGLKEEILRRRSAIMKRLGISAEELPGFQAQYKTDQTALVENGKLLSNLQSSENALKANAQQVWNTHRTLVQDGIVADNPWVTRQRLKYYQNFGSPDQKAHVKTYLDAVNAYSTEYSKFMTAANGMGGSAAPSDSARSQAGELNDPGLAATPLLAHLRQGITEAVNKRNGVAQQTEALQQKLSSYLHPHGAASQSAAQPSGAVQIHSAQEWYKLKPGTPYVDPTGVHRIKK